MIFRKNKNKNKDISISEKIKKDLILIFKQKGISVTNIDISTKEGNLNVSLNISEK